MAGIRHVPFHASAIRRIATSSLAAAIVLALATAPPVAAANNIVVLVFFGDCQFSGSNAGSGKTVKIEWRDSDGNLKSRHSVTSNSAGNFTTKCEAGELIEKGDVLQTKIGTSARSFTVPKVTVNIDRDADTISGKVDPLPPDTLEIDVLTYDGGFAAATGTPNRAFCCLNINTGEYTAGVWDDGNPNLKGWDDVYVIWRVGRGDRFVRYAAVEGVRVWLRQQFVEVAGNSGQAQNVSLYNSSATLLADATGRANRDGRFQADFLDVDGDPMRVVPGQHVTADLAPDADFDVPTISTVINAGTDKVTVDCGLGPDVGVAVSVRKRDGTGGSSRVGFTNLSESFTANFAASPAYNIVAGDKVHVFCKLISGDMVARTYTV